MPHIDAKKPPKAARQTGGEREVSVRYAQEFNPAAPAAFQSYNFTSDPPRKQKKRAIKSPFRFVYEVFTYAFAASSTATAQATVAPTIGLLPIPISPIIST